MNEPNEYLNSINNDLVKFIGYCGFKKRVIKKVEKLLQDVPLLLTNSIYRIV
jgi:hypothetical protein